MGVVVHATNHVVAVCRSRRRRCPRLNLSFEEIVLVAFDTPKLIRDVTRELEIVATPSIEVPGLSRSYALGHVMTAHGRLRAYLSVQGDAQRLADSVARLALRDSGSFVLLSTASEIPVTVESELAARGSMILPLPDLTVLDDRDRLLATRPLREVLDGHLTSPRSQPRQVRAADAFVVAPGTTWEDLEIVFRDGHTVSVRAGTERAILNYAQMGLANRTNNAPDMQWLLLEAMSREYGMLTQRSRHRDPRNKMRRHRLSERLVAFFGIDDGDPITYDKELGGWRTRFVLRPEDDVS